MENPKVKYLTKTFKSLNIKPVRRKKEQKKYIIYKNQLEQLLKNNKTTILILPYYNRTPQIYNMKKELFLNYTYLVTNVDNTLLQLNVNKNEYDENNIKDEIIKYLEDYNIYDIEKVMMNKIYDIEKSTIIMFSVKIDKKYIEKKISKNNKKELKKSFENMSLKSQYNIDSHLTFYQYFEGIQKKNNTLSNIINSAINLNKNKSLNDVLEKYIKGNINNNEILFKFKDILLRL